MKTIIVIPTYNEIDNIEKLLKTILDLKLPKTDVLIVDDNSPDGTAKVVRTLAQGNRETKKQNKIFLLLRKKKEGLGKAYVAGYKWALQRNYDRMVSMDADFSHDPKYLPKLIEKSRNNNVVVGSRYVKGGKIVGWQWYRYINSYGANFATRLLLGLKSKDNTGAFRCYPRKFIESIDLDGIIAEGYAFIVEMISYAQEKEFKIIEIPITFVDRRVGQSKVSGELTRSMKSIFQLARKKKSGFFDKNIIYLIFILIAGTILKLFQLKTRPFDGDEGLTILIANNNWPDLVARAARDVQPPFYYSLVKFFIPFSINEWTARILSALAGIALIYAVYILARKFTNKKIALIALLLTAISPYLIYPSQEARMYSLLVLLATCSYYFFYKLIKSQSAKFAIGYIMFTALAIYTQYLGFIIIASQILYLIIFYRKIITKWKTWFFSYLLIGILFLPQVQTMLTQFSARLAEKSHAFSLENIKGAIGAFYHFGVGRLFLDVNYSTLKLLISDNPLMFFVLIVSFIVPIGLFTLGLYNFYKQDKQKTWFLLFPIIVALAAAVLSTEIGARSSRYLIYIYPFYLLFVSVGIFSIWKKWLGKTIFVLFISINLGGLFTHYTRDIKAPGVNEIARFFTQNYQQDDAILLEGSFGGGDQWVLNYYLENDPKYKIYDMIGDYSVGQLAHFKTIKPEDKIKELLQNNNRVFFYDMTYETDNIPNAIKHTLGYDKEKKELIVWEVNK